MFLETVLAAGVIDDAPTLAEALLRALNWLLSIFLFLGIISLGVVGIGYLLAGGDTNRIRIAKKAFSLTLGGIALGLGALILVRLVITLFAG